MVRSPCSLTVVSIACLASCWLAPVSHGLETAIPAQPLAQALRRFAQSSGLQLVYVSHIAQGQVSSGAAAGLSDAATLEQLLRGTELRYEFVNERTVLIDALAVSSAQHARAKPAQAKPLPIDVADTLEEVLITAERRLADSQKTSISVTTLSGELLAKEARTDLRSVLLPVPGVVMQGDVGRYNVAIRGIGTNTPPNAAETTVGLNTDGIYNDMQISTAANYFDIDRVEVLRGPQGTLYGRNAAAGAVNLISNDPAPVFATNGLFELGNYQLVHLNGVLNVPVTEQLSTRLAVNSLSHNGYLSNGQNDQEARSARLKVLYSPTQKLQLLLAASSEREAGSTGTVVAFNTQPADPWIDREDTPNSSVTSAQLIYSRLDWDVDFATVTAIPAYQYRVTDNDFHSSGNRRNGVSSTLIQKSLELRMTSPSQSATQWVAGVYGYDSDGVLFFPTGPSQYAISSTALFGQATIPWSERLRGITGLRLTLDRKSRANATRNFQSDWQNLDFKLGAEFDVAQQALLYLTAASGYRPGGVYESPPGTFRTYDPEHLVSYELGAKSQFLDDRLQLNADVFIYDYKDFQATGIRFINGVQVSGYQNAPGARVAGAEIESHWLPWPKHRVEFSLAYLDAHFKPGFINNGIDYWGSTLENAPRWSGTFRYERQWAIADGTLNTTAEIISKSDYYLAYSRAAYSLQPASSTVNLSADYAFSADRWRIAAWVHNAGDYAVRTAYVTTATVGDYLTISPPRTYGLGVTAQF